MEDKLIEIMRTYTFSNTIGIVEEVQRYKEIADYFAKKSNRERYNATNSGYLGKMHDRLLFIDLFVKRESLPEEISDLCSKLLKRFKAGII